MKHSALIAAPLLLLIARAVGAAPGEGAVRIAESPLSAGNLLETALGLAFVLAVMLVLAWVVKRYVQVPGIGRGQVQILGGVSLGAREKAVLLTVEGRRLLVGVAPGRVQTLLVMDAATQTGADDFAVQLEEATRQTETSAVGETS